MPRLISLLLVLAAVGVPLFAVAQSCPADQIYTNGACKAVTGTGDQTAPSPGGTGDQTAPGPERPDNGGLVNPLKGIDSLPQLLTALLAAIVQIGTIILTLALVYVGFLFVVAQGSEEKIRDAKGALLWTLIGGLILLGASAIGAVVAATVGKL